MEKNENKELINNISSLQRLNKKLYSILLEEEIKISDLIIKLDKYYDYEELFKMSEAQLKDFHGLLIADFRYLKKLFDEEVFFKSLNDIEGIS